MGYTHYYDIPDRTQNMKVHKVANDIAELIRGSGVVIGDFEGEFGTLPVLGPDEITFNGVGDASYESFQYPPDYTRPIKPGWEFTKTDRRPYDVIVTAALIVIKHHMGDAVEVTSDGKFNSGDWYPAYDLYRQTFPDRRLPVQFDY